MRNTTHYHDNTGKESERGIEWGQTESIQKVGKKHCRLCEHLYEVSLPASTFWRIDFQPSTGCIFYTLKQRKHPSKVKFLVVEENYLCLYRHQKYQCIHYNTGITLLKRVDYAACNRGLCQVCFSFTTCNASIQHNVLYLDFELL